ncbi:glutathione S-transferase family protein [Paracoccus sp. 1_MG-2023]|uniref:glutathione S-transferase family protein n=1 Tax=unclassified Paracoccus (in: a-proteobacteria) TaxID=2688777 RepID=UPI001C07F94B|nr:MULTISPECIES: glutathione S-transferase family protein [unclassified Paracoccus (in: a-proteobacteria)]MBU2958671.1 glutathione S-transferase family protein [Paracoccus sp. C2R09]MDO6667664.1 glutathione S-transferase family protein [Paracoccus sp. 1_MG-2023]
MLVIHGVTRSRASRIIWLCHELDLPFRQVPVIQAYRTVDPDALSTASPEFLALSPAGAIPVIEDDGLVLSESMAANLHLARKHGGTVGPQDASEDALMMQWSFYAATAIEDDALTIQMLTRPEATDEDREIIDEAIARLERPLAVLEAHLTAHAYLVGGRFTVADLNMAEVIRYGWNDQRLHAAWPAISEWLDSCHARPAFLRMWEARLQEPV